MISKTNLNIYVILIEVIESKADMEHFNGRAHFSPVLQYLIMIKINLYD